MNKIGFFYSIWCDDNISKSIRYIVPFILNVKKYNESKIFNKNIFIILHTDEFTLNIIKTIAEQENVLLDNIKIKIHSRNLYLRGMSWRFESLYNDDYDICVNAEGDWPIEKYEKELQFFIDSKKYYILRDVRQINLNKCCFAGGCVYIKPKALSIEDKHKIKLCFDLISNLEHVHYGIDEFAYVKIAKTILSKYDGIIVINDKIQIFQHIEDINLEKTHVRQIFKKADILSIDEYNKLLRIYNNIFNKSCHLHYKTNTGYIINGVEYVFESPLRVSINDFCNTELLEIIDKIIA